MDCLPVELLEQILGNVRLNIEDVVSASSTCNHIRNVVCSSQYIWKNVYYKRWPNYKKIIDKADVDWITEVKYVYGIRKRARNILETMPARFYLVEYLSQTDLDEWKELTEERVRASEYVADYLKVFIHDLSPINSIECVPLFTPGNMTLIYYCRKVYEYLKLIKVKKDFNEFSSLRKPKQILEKAAVILAQWCQPELDIEYADICDRFDDLANQTRDELKILNPKHPLFKVEPEVLDKWKRKNLKFNQFNSVHNMQIVDALRVALFEKNRYRGNVTDFYTYENSLINIVLDSRCGIPITLSIIYESVARRLGLNCEPMNVPSHFLLRFKTGDSTKTEVFIDAFNHGQIIPRCNTAVIPRATAHQVLKRMASNLEGCYQSNPNYNDLSFLRSIRELLMLISPKDLNCVINLMQLCISLKIDTQFLEDIIITTRKPRARGDVEFAVGMIMRHRLFNYTGVITGWTPLCEASANWQEEMGVDRLKYKSNQPFYGVLLEDGNKTYVAQENIDIIGTIKNSYFSPELGRHFSHFFVNHYVPNVDKEKQYCNDAAVRHNYYQTKLWSN